MSTVGSDESRAAIGGRIQQARRELGLTQSELAARIGVSLEVLDRYETGRADASDRLGRIAEVTDRPVSWFSSAHDDSDLVERIDAALGEPSSWPSAGGPPARSSDEADLALRTKEQYAGEGGVMGDSKPAEPEAVSTQSAPSALPAPPLNIRHEDLPRKTLGYSPKATAELFDRVADAYKRVWEDRTKLERRLDKLQVELAEEREKHEDDASEAAGLTAEKLKRADANQRELALQLKQVASALAASRAQESQLSERVSELQTELQLAGSHAQDSQLSQRVSDLATKLQLAEERAVEATDGLALAAAELERFRQQEHSLAEALIWARHTASELSEKAEQEAKQIVEDAERRAAELLSEGKREVERLTSERDRLETLASEVQEDLSVFLLGALERLKERVESTTEPGESVPDATGAGEGQRTGKARQS